MRIDVHLPMQDLEADLARLHDRLRTPGDALHGLPELPLGLPGLVCHYREVAGEIYLYVEDPTRHRLAGCTVFNRAPEIDRRLERCVRSPHSRYGAEYRRRGIATAVYTWALATGWCLISGPRQSAGAHGLWLSLGLSHELHYVQVRDKQVRHLGRTLAPGTFDEFETRMLLLGEGWNLDRLAAVTRDEPAFKGERHGTPSASAGILPRPGLGRQRVQGVRVRAPAARAGLDRPVGAHR